MTRQERYKRYNRLVRKLRQRIFDYYDASERKGRKASRILEKAISRKVANQPRPAIDQWGATAEDRRQLAAHGMAWGD